MSHGKAKPKPPEAGGEKVPIWIISFADMITLLLSFFVMLQTMAHEKSSELFKVGQGSFNRALANMGLPDVLFGKAPADGKDYRKIKYPTNEEHAQEDIPPERVIDADDEKIRNLFDNLRQAMDSDASDVNEQVLDVRSTPLKFADGSAALDEAGKAYLAALAGELRQNLAGKAVRIYLTGLPAGSQNSREQIILAAKRAAAAEAHLRSVLEPELAKRQWELYSAGGTGEGRWGGQVASTPAAKPTLIITVAAKPG